MTRAAAAALADGGDHPDGDRRWPLCGRFAKDDPSKGFVFMIHKSLA